MSLYTLCFFDSHEYRKVVLVVAADNAERAFRIAMNDLDAEAEGRDEDNDFHCVAVFAGDVTGQLAGDADLRPQVFR